MAISTTMHIYRRPPWSIEHRCLAYWYTLYISIYGPSSQSSIEALHTITLYIYIYLYIDPPSQLSIEALHTITLYIYLYMNPLVNQA